MVKQSRVNSNYGVRIRQQCRLTIGKMAISVRGLESGAL